MANDIIAKINLDDSQAMAKINKLKSKLAELQTEKSTKSGIVAEIDEYTKRLQEAIAKKKELVASGNGGGSREKGLQANIDRMLSERQALSDKYGGYANLKSELANLDKQIGKTERKIGLLQKAQARLASGGMSKLTTGVNQGVKTFLKYGIGIRSLFALFNKLRGVIQEGIANMAKLDAETRNSLTGIKSSMAELKGNFTSIFAGILNAIAPVIQTIISWISTAISKIAELIAALSGKGSFKKAVANTGAISNNLKGAAGGASEVKKQLAGFDELNVLQDNAGGGGGGGASDVGYVEEAVELSPRMEKLKEIFENIYTIIKKIWDDTQPLREWIGDKLVAIFDTVLDLIYKISEFLAGDMSFQEFIDSLSPLEGILLGIATAIGIIKGYKFIAGLIADIPKLISTVSGLIMSISPTALIITGIVTAIVLLLQYGDKVSAWLLKIKQKIDSFIDNVRTTVSNFFNDAITTLSQEGTLISSVFLLIYSAISVVWESICAVVKAAVDIVIDVVADFAQMIRNIAQGDWKGAWEKFKQIFVDVFSNIGNMLKGIFNSIIGVIEGFINNAISGINNLLSAINTVGQFLGFSGTFQIGYVSLPRLATGGIVDRATPFIAGEAGKEAVIPLERNTEWITLVADGLIDRLLDNSVINRIANAFMSVPLPAMAMGGVVPPRASGSFSMFSDEDISRIVSGLQAAVGELANQPIVVDSKMYLDKRQIGSAVTEYQREQNKAKGG